MRGSKRKEGKGWVQGGELRFGKGSRRTGVLAVEVRRGGSSGGRS